MIFIFDPLAVKPDIDHATKRKVLRWAVGLSEYNYVCLHNGGEENVWADLMTHWAVPMTIRRLVHVSPLPTTFNDFEWPSSALARTSQEKFADHRPAAAIESDGLYRFPSVNFGSPTLMSTYNFARVLSLTQVQLVTVDLWQRSSPCQKNSGGLRFPRTSTSSLHSAFTASPLLEGKVPAPLVRRFTGLSQETWCSSTTITWAKAAQARIMF